MFSEALQDGWVRYSCPCGYRVQLRVGVARCPRCTTDTNRPVLLASVPCLHQSDPTGENSLIRCTTCKGNVRLKFPIHACEVHGHCLPTYTGDKKDGLPMTCRRCIAEGLGYEPEKPNG